MRTVSHRLYDGVRRQVWTETERADLDARCEWVLYFGLNHLMATSSRLQDALRRVGVL